VKSWSFSFSFDMAGRYAKPWLQVSFTIRRTEAEIHSEELMADCTLAISGETIFKIDPLK
jgi:hypothetical protein